MSRIWNSSAWLNGLPAQTSVGTSAFSTALASKRLQSTGSSMANTGFCGYDSSQISFSRTVGTMMASASSHRTFARWARCGTANQLSKKL